MGIARRPARGGLEILDRYRPRSDRALLVRVVDAARDHARRAGDRHAAGLEVALLLTDDDGIAELHGRFLDDPTETDVMSFHDREEQRADVVVNVARARREALRRAVTIRSEVALYVVHGLLHCCGYDDHDPAARRAMRAAEREVLASVGMVSAPVDVP